MPSAGGLLDSVGGSPAKVMGPSLSLAAAGVTGLGITGAAGVYAFVTVSGVSAFVAVSVLATVAGVFVSAAVAGVGAFLVGCSMCLCSGVT